MMHASENPNHPIQIILDSAANYQRIRFLWNSLTLKEKPDLHLRVNTFDTELFPQNCIVDVNNSTALKLQNYLTLVSSAGTFALISSSGPLFWPDNLVQLTLSINPTAALVRDINLIEITNTSLIVFTDYFDPQKIVRGFWKRLFASNLPNILRFDTQGGLTPLRLFSEKNPITLFVFPERMLPIKRAYYMRAFDLIIGLAYSGHAPAVMVLGPNNEDLERIRLTLEIFSPKVFANPLVRGKIKLNYRLLRWTERGLRKIVGLRPSVPIRYSERGMIFATQKNSRLLTEAIKSIPSLRNVIYTGSWFGNALSAAKRDKPKLRFFCDTHDIFFLLDLSNYGDDRYFLNFQQWEKKQEIKDLAQADIVIAISPSDQNALLETKLNRKIIVESGSFSHAFSGLNSSNSVDITSFGFIGSNNRNNQRCINLIEHQWWPKILKYNPNSKLHIAGGICLSNEVKSLIDNHADSIISHGFVDSIEIFYSKIAIFLSPIEVKGGLNFKSVEALMAGCFLLTSKLGSHCLSSNSIGVHIVNPDGSNLHELLGDLNSRSDLTSERGMIRTMASQIYGDSSSFLELIDELSK